MPGLDPNSLRVFHFTPRKQSVWPKLKVSQGRFKMHRKIGEEHTNGEERTFTVDEPGALTVQSRSKGLSR